MPNEQFDYDDDDLERIKQCREDWDIRVRCANCGKSIPAVATRCPDCRFDFHGEAQDFEYEADEEIRPHRLPMWVIITAVVLLMMMVLGVFNFAFW